MKKITIQLILLSACVTLTACASTSSKHNNVVTADSINQALANESNPDNRTMATALGGALASTMDELDRSRFTRALDKAPGKMTAWTNGLNGAKYQVTPTRKISVSGYQYCRNYSLVKTQDGNMQEFNGNACIGKNGSWEGV